MTKTGKIKRTPAKGKSPAKSSKTSNGGATKSAARKKSMYERWIEKYGVDDSEGARKMLEVWKMVYESYNKPTS